MPLHAPASRLRRAPEQEVDGASAGLECMNRVAAKSIDANILKVGLTHRRGPVVRLNDVPPVFVLDSKHPGVRSVPAAAGLVSVRSVSKGYPVPAPAIDLKHAPRRY